MLSQSETHFVTAFQILIPVYIGLQRRFPAQEPFFPQLLLYALEHPANPRPTPRNRPRKRRIHRPIQQKSQQTTKTKIPKALCGAGKALRTCRKSGTAILAVRFTRQSARRKKANCRARMALRRMGKMPMPRQNGFSYAF